MVETKQTLISSFHKNSVEIIKIHVQEWKAQTYVDVRIWYLDNPQKPGSEVPTKKGICISAELLPDLLSGLREAQKHLGKTHGSLQEGRSPARE